MTRRLAVWSCALLGCVLLGPTSLTRAAEPTAVAPPNFVQILTDDQTIDGLRYMPKTKRLLAAQGTSFTNYNVVQPLCCPSRATFLSWSDACFIRRCRFAPWPSLCCCSSRLRSAEVRFRASA